MSFTQNYIYNELYKITHYTHGNAQLILQCISKTIGTLHKFFRRIIPVISFIKSFILKKEYCMYFKKIRMWLQYFCIWLRPKNIMLLGNVILQQKKGILFQNGGDFFRWRQSAKSVGKRLIWNPLPIDLWSVNIFSQAYKKIILRNIDYEETTCTIIKKIEMIDSHGIF